MLMQHFEAPDPSISRNCEGVLRGRGGRQAAGWTGARVTTGKVAKSDDQPQVSTRRRGMWAPAEMRRRSLLRTAPLQRRPGCV